MAVFKTYKGGRLDLEHYKGKTISDFQVDVYNEDDSDFDLSIYDNIVLQIFEKIHGTQVLIFDMLSYGGINVDSPAGNVIYWNATKAEMNIRPKFYWHECYGVLPSGQEELIYEGVSEVI